MGKVSYLRQNSDFKKTTKLIEFKKYIFFKIKKIKNFYESTPYSNNVS